MIKCLRKGFVGSAAHGMLPTAKAVMRLATKYRVEMPICEQIYKVLFENLDPLEAISQLMSREPKAERVG